MSILISPLSHSPHSPPPSEASFDNHDFVMTCKKAEQKTMEATLKKVHDLLAAQTDVKWKTVTRQLIKGAIAECTAQISSYPNLSAALRNLTIRVIESQFADKLKEKIEELHSK